MINSATTHGDGIVSSVLGIIMLIVGAAGIFGELQSALNTIWKVKPKPTTGFLVTVRNRIFSMGLVLATSFVLLVSLLISTALSAAGDYFLNTLPGGALLWALLNGIISFLIISLMFALLFKYVPDVILAWNDVLIGAAGTGALFIIGRTVIGVYLGRSSVSSAYGAAGSLAIVLLWVYYVAR